jgi:tRNA A37 threonylcarbamoyladenosine dehydratase
MSFEPRKAFRGIRAVFGETGFRALQESHVMVIGVGGIGSWLAETLCRSAVGSLTLLDSDTIECTNTNRQLHTLTSTEGLYKVDVLGQRLLDINPLLKLKVQRTRLTPENIQEKLRDCPRYVGEAIDDIDAKAYVDDFLCKRRSVFIVAGGAGGRKDPRLLDIADLAQAKGNSLIARLRTILRREYGYPKGGVKMNIPCVFSSEKPVYSAKEDYLSGDLPAFGASMAVTASAGLMMASWIISRIVADKR